MRNKIILFCILLLGAALRLYDLSGTPIHLTPDEAALGYNAYSILKTGRDEHGARLPIIFRSYNDWKPGLYVYATTPFVAILGLNEFSTRLPGALSGVLAVWLIYLVVGQLFEKNGKLSLVAATLLAILPWHIHFSRGAWEAGLSLTLTLAGIYFFLRAVRDKPKWIILSAIFFGLTLITYQGAKLSTGLLVLGLITFWAKQIITIERKILFISIILGLTVAMPILLSIGTDKSARLEVFSVFSYPRDEKVVNHILDQGEESKNSLTYILFHSEKLHFITGVLSRYLNHYSPRFLFFEGDWSHFNLSVPKIGVILLMDIILLMAGVVALTRMKLSPPVLFIAYWLLLAPLPAALSRDSLHAIRSFNLVVPLAIILGLGAIFLWEKVKSKKWIVIIFVAFYIANFIYFLDGYFVHMNVHNGQHWQYGYKQMIEKLAPYQKAGKPILITQSYDQPYMYFLFHQKYDPATYQKNVNMIEGPAGKLDAWLVPKLDNITFEFIDWHRDNGKKGTIVVGTPIQVPPEDSSNPERFKLIDEIKYPNGEVAFRIVEVL